MGFLEECLNVFSSCFMLLYIVYATTSANPSESSWACYYDETLETYLGDVFSVKWMENIDKASC